MQIGLGISPTQPYGVAVPAFTPASISGLQLWLDASDASTLFTDSAGTTAATADGDPVGCWKDKSGNDYHATQTDGTFKPLRKNAIQNAKNIIRFDGTNDCLVCGNVINLVDSSLAAFVAFKMTSSDGQIIGKSHAGAGNGRWTTYRLSGKIYLFLEIDNQYSIESVDSGTSFRVLSAIYRRNSYSVLRINNTQLNSIYTASSSTYITTDIFQIGAYQDSSGNEGNGNPMAGDIGEILIYRKSSISDENINTIENYLMSKWGLL